MSYRKTFEKMLLAASLLGAQQIMRSVKKKPTSLLVCSGKDT